jgi:hypothetical protein
MRILQSTVSRLATLVVLGLAASSVGCVAESDVGASEDAIEELPAGLVNVECVTDASFGEEGVDQHTIRFTATGLDQIETTDLVMNEDDYIAVLVDPANAYIEALNENISTGRENGKFFISGDSDGFFLVDLVLYENSRLTHGYLKMRDLQEGTGDLYTTVQCTLAQCEGESCFVPPAPQ